MKLEVTLSYDDKNKAVGDNPLKYHRNNIGITTDTESSIFTHIFPNPDKWYELVVCFPRKAGYIISVASLDQDIQLVASNKSALTKIGQELVDAGLEDQIQKIFDGSDTTNPIINYLKPEHFAKLEFDFEEGAINFVSGTVKLMHPKFPKGLGLSPKVELSI